MCSSWKPSLPFSYITEWIINQSAFYQVVSVTERTIKPVHTYMYMWFVRMFSRKLKQRCNNLSKVTQDIRNKPETRIQIPSSVQNTSHYFMLLLCLQQKWAWEVYNLAILLDQFLQNTWEAGPERLRHLRSSWVLFSRD